MRVPAGKLPASRWAPVLLPAAVVVLSAAAVFFVFQRQLSGGWFALGVHPELVRLLEASREDQKQLADLDPEQRDAYRERFEDIQTLVRRLQILQHNREQIVERYEFLLLGLMGGLLGLSAAVYVLRQGRQEARLERLRGALQKLSIGDPDLGLDARDTRRRDTVGKIAGMIDETSRLMARHRQRLEALKNLSGWQEAARRQAHEMRTPLTAARLELDRLRQLAREGDGDTLLPRVESLDQELDRLTYFTQGFTSFARLPEPKLAVVDLPAFLDSFRRHFTDAWPEVELRGPAPEATSDTVRVHADAEMLRQVLVNLCDNAALAGASRIELYCRPAGVEAPETIYLDVFDNGTGVDPQLRDRLFEPYVTSRPVGAGMGLGLAISRKILLDHGGDLQLLEEAVESAPDAGPGTTFRLTFPTEPPSSQYFTEVPADSESASEETKAMRIRSEETP